MAINTFPAVDGKRYHFTIGFPKTLIIPDRLFKLAYSKHALARAKERMPNITILPTVVRLTASNLMEVRTDSEGKFIQTAIVKLHWDKKKYLVLVLDVQFHKYKAVVITTYFDYKTNPFDTLDKSNYNVPE